MGLPICFVFDMYNNMFDVVFSLYLVKSVLAIVWLLLSSHGRQEHPYQDENHYDNSHDLRY